MQAQHQADPDPFSDLIASNTNGQANVHSAAFAEDPVLARTSLDQAHVSSGLPNKAPSMPGTPMRKDTSKELENAAIVAANSAVKKLAESFGSTLEEILKRLEALENRTEQIQQVVSDLQEVGSVRENAARERANSIEKSLREVQRHIQIVRDKVELADATAELAKLANNSKTTTTESVVSAPTQQEIKNIDADIKEPATLAMSTTPAPVSSNTTNTATQVAPAALDHKIPDNGILPPPPHMPLPPPPPLPGLPPSIQVPAPDIGRHHSGGATSPMPYASAPPPPSQQPTGYGGVLPSPYAAPPAVPPPQPPASHHQTHPPPPMYGSLGPPQPRPPPHLGQTPPPPTHPYTATSSNTSGISYPTPPHVPPPPMHYASGSGSGGYPQPPPHRTGGGGMAYGQSSSLQQQQQQQQPHQTSKSVPIEKVIDDVAVMGFSRDQVRGVLQELAAEGRSIDLNVVLDRLGAR